MKKIIRNTTLFFPFLLLILVNEHSRPTKKSSNYIFEKPTINTSIANVDSCTWHCHNNTAFCKENHVKYLNQFDKSDQVYFGIINTFQKTGTYALANVFFLVMLFPFIIWYFIVKSLNIQDEINMLKRKL